MQTINEIVSANLKRLREQKKLSLDALSKCSGVSKSMLGQIERGEATPTIATVWKIANGMKISFSELISRPETDFELVNTHSLEPFVDSGGRFRNYPLFYFEPGRRFEMYYIEIDPDGEYVSDAHPEGTQEYVTVFAGALLLQLNDEDLRLGVGEATRFKADRPHRYRSVGEQSCKLHMLIYYP